MLKNGSKNTLFLAIITFITMGGMAGDDTSKTINIFTKANIKWMDKSQVKSREYGFTKYSSVSPGEMWFKSTPGKASRYVCSFKPFSVKGYDFLNISYKTSPGTFLIIDAWWNKGKIKRIARAVTSNNKWETLSVPIRGNSLRLNFSILDEGLNKTKVSKVQFKPITLVKDTSTTLHLYDLHQPLLIPQPKEIKDLNREFILYKDGKVNFSIQLNSEEAKLKKIIAEEITKEFGAGPSDKIKTVIKLEFGKECSIQVPDKKEAYAIKFSKHNNQTIITLAAKDKAGLYWAWQTLRQLISKQAGMIKVKACDIKDWPDFQLRCILAYDIDTMRSHMAVKINTALSANWRLENYYWKSDSLKFKKYFRYLKTLCNYALPRGCDILNILCVFDQKGSITVSDDKQIERLFKLYDKTLSLGNKQVVLGIDDGGRKKESFTSADRKIYNNDVLLSHAWFMKKMSERIWKDYPDTLIIGTTKNYERTTGVAGYYDRIGVSPELVMDWTGSQSVTFNYPDYVVKNYKKGIEGRRFKLFDNTCTQAHGMYRNLTICEQYGAGYKELFTPECIGVGGCIDMSNEVRKIRCMSMAEFMWNASRYDAERARQQAIAKVAGNVEAVKPILLFSQEFLKVAYKYPIDKRIRPIQDFILGKGIRPAIGTKKLEERELSKYSIDDEEYKQLCKRISLMGKLLEQIEEKSKNKMLTAEFKLFYRNMTEIITYLRKNSLPAPTITPEGSFTFNMNNVPGGTIYKKRGPAKLMSAAIYGKQTANNTFTATFNLASLPVKKNIVLELEGWDCDKNLPLMLIKVNNHKVFSGKTTFGHTYPYKTGPGKMSISFPVKYLCKGKNIIKIINNASVSDFIDNWIVLAGITLKFQNDTH